LGTSGRGQRKLLPSALLSIPAVLTLADTGVDGTSRMVLGADWPVTGGEAPFALVGPAHDHWTWVCIASLWLLSLVAGLLWLRTRRPISAREILLIAGASLTCLVAGMLSFHPSLDPGVEFAFSALITGTLALSLGFAGSVDSDLDTAARDTGARNLTRGVILIDKRNRIADISPAAARIMGQEASKITGQPAEQALSRWPELFDGHRDASEACTRVVVDSENGSNVLDVHISALYDSDRQPAGQLVILHNVGAKGRSDAVPEAGGPRAERLLGTLPGMAYRRRIGPGWPMEYVSEGSRQVTGYAPGHLTQNQGMAYYDLVHPDDREGIRITLRRELEEGGTPDVTYRITTADGEEKWVRDRGRIVRYAERGDPLLEGIIIDIAAPKQTEQDLLRRAARLEALREATLAVTSELELDALLNAVVTQAVDLVGGDGGRLELYRPEEDLFELATSVGLPMLHADNAIPRDESLAREILESRNPLTIDDYPRCGEHGKRWEGPPPTLDVVGAPVRWRDKFLGTLAVMAQSPRAFSSDDAELLNRFALQAAAAIENARRYEKTALRAEHLAVINRIARAASKTLDLNVLTEVVHREVEVAFEPDAFFLALYDEETDELSYRIQVDGGATAPPERVPLGTDLTARVVREGKPLLIKDFEHDQQDLPPAELRGTMMTSASWLGVPMQVAAKTVGVICVQSCRPAAYCEEDQRVLSTIADQVGVSVENARLYEETSRRLAQAEALRETMVAATSTLDFDQVLERTLGALNATGGAELIGFAMPNWEGQSLRLHPSQVGFPHEALELPLGLDSSVCGRVFLTGEPIVIDDVRDVPFYHEGVSETRSELAVPVRVHGQVAAVLNVESPRLNAFDEDLDFYTTIASQLSIALQNARLFEAERQQRRQTEALEEAAALVSGTLDLDQVLDRILEQAERVVNGNTSNVMLVEDDNTARIMRRRGYEGRDWGVLSLSIDQYPLLQQMIRTGDPVVVPDTAAEPTWVQDEGQEEWQSYVGAPIQVGGVVVGFLNVNSTRAATFTGDDAQRLQAFANHAATAIENAQLYQTLHDYADALEQRVRERTSQLRDQYAQLETILDSTADGIVLADSDGKLVLVNPVARKWLTQTLSPQESDELREAVKALATRAEGRPEILLELAGLDLQLAAAPVSEPAVEGASAVIAIHDVTHLKTLNRMKSRFVSNVSHELRTPIATIKLLAHLIQEQPEKRDEYLEPLVREADHQARLVRDILEMSRVDAGRLELRPEPTSLNHLIEAAVLNHENMAQELGLRLEYHPVKPDPITLADSQWMTQALGNLLTNAIRYTPGPGTVMVSSDRETADGRSWATVTISDTGIGIPEEEMPYIFDRFFRGEQPRSMQVSGTGLGLAFMKEIVELHGGQVTVGSEVGKGSTFTVWLPLKAGSDTLG
jgi:PAS domain S-box-containing protein